jgi:hypothetical protein
MDAVWASRLTLMLLLIIGFVIVPPHRAVVLGAWCAESFARLPVEGEVWHIAVADSAVDEGFGVNRAGEVGKGIHGGTLVAF